MINVMNNNNHVEEKGLDSQLWHACAGGMVRMPPVNSRVLYFPQGHAEHSGIRNLDFGSFRRIAPYILCRVSAVKFMADPDTDEVYARIRLQPLANQIDYDFADDNNNNNNNGGLGFLGFDDDSNNKRVINENNKEKPSSFAKTLTQSDANNGGGFSVPRYCAETIFPRLDYAAEPPVQAILVKDVHGHVWKFRHIYRGTPRRHLLTTGWSSFVNNKKLVAGDSIVFLRADNGELCVGIRRAKRGIGGGFVENSAPCSLYGGGFAGFRPTEKENVNGGRNPSAESVIEAANLAANGRSFEVVYYPRASTPEFCVKASTVKAAMAIQWCPGMRFKMAFETEDSSRISWFMGTISSVQVEDQISWPNSPWRLLQVAWDEPELLQNVKRVNPWLVELVASMPAMHLSPFSPPRKKLRIPQPPDFPLLMMSTSIQGARHSSHFGLDHNHHLRFDQMHPPALAFPSRFTNHDLSPSRFPLQEHDDNVSCLLTMGNGSPKTGSKKKDDEKKDKRKPLFVLFGQPILTEEQLSESFSGDTTANASDGSVVLQNGSVRSSSDDDGPWVESGHCKVFMESEDVGRSLDLTALRSYDELYKELGGMFGFEKSDALRNLIYRNAEGVVKHTGDEPFSEFSKVARRLTIVRGGSGR